jgi:hypothetical protein
MDETCFNTDTESGLREAISAISLEYRDGTVLDPISGNLRVATRVAYGRMRNDIYSHRMEIQRDRKMEGNNTRRRLFNSPLVVSYSERPSNILALGIEAIWWIERFHTEEGIKNEKGA